MIDLFVGQCRRHCSSRINGKQRNNQFSLMMLLLLCKNEVMSFTATTTTSVRHPATTNRIENHGLVPSIRLLRVQDPSDNNNNVLSTRHNLNQSIKRSNKRLLVKSSTRLQVSSTVGVVAAAAARTVVGATKIDLGLLYGLLLAFQFALQPILIKKFVPREKIVGTTYVFSESFVQFIIAISFLVVSNKSVMLTSFSSIPSIGSVITVVQSFSYSNFILQSFQLAGIPAGLAVLQNFCKLLGYHKLQPITFNAINQTKTIFAAIFCYILFNQKQSSMQIVSLIILLLSAFIMENIIPLPNTYNSSSSKLQPVISIPTAAALATVPSNDISVQQSRTSTSISATIAPNFDEYRTTTKNNIIQSTIVEVITSIRSSIGLVAVLGASAISGYGGALTQKALQSTSTIAFTAQLSFFSMIYLLVSTSTGMTLSINDREKIKSHGVFAGWTIYTLIPVCTSAIGGILVGMVTKYAGVVRKGFALILGLFLSGMLQNLLATRTNSTIGSTSGSTEIRSVTSEQWVGGILAALSIWMHSRFA